VAHLAKPPVPVEAHPLGSVAAEPVLAHPPGSVAAVAAVAAVARLAHEVAVPALASRSASGNRACTGSNSTPASLQECDRRDCMCATRTMDLHMSSCAGRMVSTASRRTNQECCPNADMPGNLGTSATCGTISHTRCIWEGWADATVRPIHPVTSHSCVVRPRILDS
jgi:hypothetical protein